MVEGGVGFQADLGTNLGLLRTLSELIYWVNLETTAFTGSPESLLVETYDADGIFLE
jgi:hypothetical protein